MPLRPVRLAPGADLRRAVENLAAQLPQGCGFVVVGIGSLSGALLRMAGEPTARPIEGPLEIIALAGSVCPDGAHLHMAVADARGEVVGGHVCHGCIVRTTAEVLIAELPGYRLGREFDPRTGFRELVVRHADEPADEHPTRERAGAAQRRCGAQGGQPASPASPGRERPRIRALAETRRAGLAQRRVARHA
ncbi:MAG: PPC domain-containing DNA-binding protein, partial [Burkholderiaceae bacterium]